MSGNGKLWRSRWAAIGAAVAVTLGAGGLLTAQADSAPSAFVAISPARVLDTRNEAFGSAFEANSPRTLQVTGTIPTINGNTVTNAQVVPAGATAIVANVTAVGPTSGGFVSVRPGNATGTPATSNINFTASGVVVPNAVTVEVPTTGAGAGQIQLFFGGPAGERTDLLVDIVGYYQAGATGPQGPAGPAGPAGATGATGPRGFSAWDTIPSGVTVTGNISVDTNVGAGPPFSVEGFSVDFPFTAASAIDSVDVGFGVGSGVAAQGDLIAGCTGSHIAPMAPAGKVCIYVYGSPGIGALRGNALPYANRRGFYIEYDIDYLENVTDVPENVGLFAVWAYTAP